MVTDTSRRRKVLHGSDGVIAGLVPDQDHHRHEHHQGARKPEMGRRGYKRQGAYYIDAARVQGPNGPVPGRGQPLTSMIGRLKPEKDVG